MLLNALANGGLADSAEFWVDHMQRAARLAYLGGMDPELWGIGFYGWSTYPLMYLDVPGPGS